MLSSTPQPPGLCEHAPQICVNCGYCGGQHAFNGAATATQLADRRAHSAMQAAGWCQHVSTAGFAHAPRKRLRQPSAAEAACIPVERQHVRRASGCSWHRAAAAASARGRWCLARSSGRDCDSAAPVASGNSPVVPEPGCNSASSAAADAGEDTDVGARAAPRDGSAAQMAAAQNTSAASASIREEDRGIFKWDFDEETKVRAKNAAAAAAAASRAAAVEGSDRDFDEDGDAKADGEYEGDEGEREDVGSAVPPSTSEALSRNLQPGEDAATTCGISCAAVWDAPA